MPKKPRVNKHLRDLDSTIFVVEPVPPDFQLFATEKVLPTIEFTGKKLVDKKTIAMHCLHKLYLAGISGRVVADSRRKTVAGALLRVGVWDAIEAAGYARKCLGSEASKNITRYQASTKLLDLRKDWELPELYELTLYRNTELEDPTRLALVYCNPGRLGLDSGRIIPEDIRLQAVPFPKGPGNDYFRDVEDRIEAINESNLSHSWKAYRTDTETGARRAQPVNPCLRQVHSKEFFRAVRLYSWGELSGQDLPKSVRKTLLIDGEPTCELDFSAMAIRMVYHYRHEETGNGDLYRPERVFSHFYSMDNANGQRLAVLRDVVKCITNICLNTQSRGRANSAAGQYITNHPVGPWVHKIICRTEGISIPELVDRVVAAHPPSVAEAFFCEYGLDLMTTDGLIMLHILTAFAEAGRPALGIHDSLVVRQSDREFALATMNEVYYRFTMNYPVIHGDL